jgi:DNA-binding LacI/PurR family transcriptional regulator
MSVTIRDVAVDAGVSIATVSHVINRSKNVSEPIACRVRESIERLNYYPNQVSGGLRLNKTYTVGLLIPTITNETFARLADSIQGILFEQGFNLIVCNTHYDVAVEEKALNTLMMKRVDAVLAIPAAASSPSWRRSRNPRSPSFCWTASCRGCRPTPWRPTTTRGSIWPSTISSARGTGTSAMWTE